MPTAPPPPHPARPAPPPPPQSPARLDVLVLCPGADQFYLSGFEHGHAGERLLALVVKRDGSSHWIAPAMNVPQVEVHAAAGQWVRGWADAEGYLPALR